MSESKGFKRLKGLASAGAIGVAGLLGGVSARAATTATGLSVTRGGVTWGPISNNTEFPSSSDQTTTNGATYISSSASGFGISDARYTNGTTAFNDAFDNALLLAVDGNLFVNPDATVDLTGDDLTSDVVNNIVAGVDAQIQYHFYPGRPVVRALYTLTNTTGAPIVVDPVVLSDYGSDDDTTTRSTSDADTTIENTDFWYITDENDDDPRITTTRYGTGAAVVPFNALTPSDSAPEIAVTGLRFPTSIPAGETIRIMVFIELGDPNAAPAVQAAAAADFESMPALDAAGLLSDIDDVTRATIINYAFATRPAATAVPIFSPLGLLALFGLMGGAGFFEMRRRKPS